MQPDMMGVSVYGIWNDVVLPLSLVNDNIANQIVSQNTKIGQYKVQLVQYAFYNTIIEI